MRADRVDLVATADVDGEPIDVVRAGWAYPVEVMTADLDDYARFVAEEHRSVFTKLQPDEVVLGDSSAQVRRLDVGGTVTFANGLILTVRAIVPDDAVSRDEQRALRSVDRHERSLDEGLPLDRYNVELATGDRNASRGSVENLPNTIVVHSHRYSDDCGDHPFMR